MIGIGMTNAPACVAPPGGSQKVVGTNPIAMSVPAREGGVAFQFDQSTTVVIIGRIRIAAEAGEKIPMDWAVDKNGQPIKGEVEIAYREFHNAAEIIASGIPMTDKTGEKYMQTAGMFEVKGSVANETVEIAGCAGSLIVTGFEP